MQNSYTPLGYRLRFAEILFPPPLSKHEGYIFNFYWKHCGIVSLLVFSRKPTKCQPLEIGKKILIGIPIQISHCPSSQIRSFKTMSRLNLWITVSELNSFTINTQAVAWLGFLFVCFCNLCNKRTTLQVSLIQTMQSSYSHRTAIVSVCRKKHMLVCLRRNEPSKRGIESTAHFKLKIYFHLKKKKRRSSPYLLNRLH